MEKHLKQLSELNRLGKSMRLAAEEWSSEFQTLISIILSARNLDEVTIRVCKQLFSEYPTAEKLAGASVKEIEEIIFPINFYQNKSKYIINCANEIIEKYKGKVPHDFEELISLPGVGRKTANVFLSEVGEHGIGVDTHLSYVSRKLGWSKNTNPHKIEEDLKKLFSKRYWNKINPTAVRFGKTYTSFKEKDKILEEIKEIE